MKHLTGIFVKLEYAIFLDATKAGTFGKIENYAGPNSPSTTKLF
jgi:hypothetical protein